MADIIALIGAGAWLPHVYRWLARPKLVVAVSSSMEIGFSELGPIVNLPVGIKVKYRDALVKNAYLQVEHAQGERHEFRWAWLHQVKGIIEGVPIPGGRLAFRTQDEAIAIQLTTRELTERRIGFQNMSYRKEFRDRNSALIELYEHLKSQSDGVEQFKRCKELSDAVAWWKQQMPWKEGRSTFTLQLFIDGRSECFEERFTADISRLDMNYLDRNKALIERYVSNAIATDQSPPQPTEPLSWNWITLTTSF